MDKSIAVHKRKDIIMLNPMNRTTEWLWIDSVPHLFCSTTTSDEDLGALAREVLAVSKQDVPHPTTWDDSLIQPLLKIANVKSYTTFVKGTLYCSIRDDGKVITCTATANMGSRGGFIPIQDLIVQIPSSSSNEEIGAAIQKALSLSK